jgi:hypothetical protein
MNSNTYKSAYIRSIRFHQEYAFARVAYGSMKNTSAVLLDAEINKKMKKNKNHYLFGQGIIVFLIRKYLRV